MLKKILTQLLNIKHYYVSEIILFPKSEIKLKLKRKDNIYAIWLGCNHKYLQGHHSTDNITIRDLSISGRKVFLIIEMENIDVKNVIEYSLKKLIGHSLKRQNDMQKMFISLLANVQTSISF